MAPQLIFLTLTVLAVGVVVMIDRFAGRMAGDDDDVTAPPQPDADLLTLTLPDPLAEAGCDGEPGTDTTVALDVPRPA